MIIVGTMTYANSGVAAMITAKVATTCYKTLGLECWGINNNLFLDAYSFSIKNSDRTLSDSI